MENFGQVLVFSRAETLNEASIQLNSIFEINLQLGIKLSSAFDKMILYVNEIPISVLVSL